MDFARPTKFTKDQHRRLELAHEAFCQTATARLSAELRVPLRLEVVDVAQLTWTNALAEVPDASLSAIVDVAPFRTKLLLSAEMSLMLSLIERLMGGALGREVPQRKLTDIDRALASHVFERLLDQLSVTWQDLAETTLTLHDLEQQAGSAQIAPLSEPTLCITLEALLDSASSSMLLLLPYRSIEPVAAQLRADDYGDGGADPAVLERVRGAMGDVEVQLRAEVASVRMATADVLAVRAGDVLRFGRPATHGVTVFADERPVYRARPGRSGNRRAVEILEPWRSA